MPPDGEERSAEREERRRAWDERHRRGELETHETNAVLVADLADIAPGRALDLAAGDGTNAIWLAARGWQVTAVDWSAAALDRGRAAAASAGVEVSWLEQDLLEWSPPARAFDLVTIAYLHPGREERRVIYARAADAVTAGGHLIVVGHDPANVTEGTGGPRDPARAFTSAELVADLLADTQGFETDFEVESATVIRHRARHGRGPIDAVLRVRRVR